MTALLWLLGLLALARLTELAVSNRNRKSHPKARLLKEPLFFWMVLLHAAFFAALPAEHYWLGGTFGGWLSWLAVAVTALAFALRFWTLATMGRSWNVRVVYGKDYPIVAHGPYRYIRHPNYAVVLLELAFIPLIFHLYWSAAILTTANFLVLRIRIRNEEAVLFQNPDWVKKMAPKPRFLPRFGFGKSE